MSSSLHTDKYKFSETNLSVSKKAKPKIEVEISCFTERRFSI